MKSKNHKIKTSFVSPEGLKTQANNTGMILMIYKSEIRKKGNSKTTKKYLENNHKILHSKLFI